MTSLQDDDAGAALAGLLDDWSDSELLPLFAPPPLPRDSGGSSLTSSGDATNEDRAAALAVALVTSEPPLLPQLAVCDGSEDAESASVKPETKLSASGFRRKRTGDSNVTRKREREELRRLEIEAFCLESQLASMHRRRQLTESSGGCGGGCSSLDMWAQVARNQLLAKQRAELQNATLRELLREQLRLTRSMERMVNRRPSDTALHRVFGITSFIPRKRLHPDTSVGDDIAYQRLFQSVDQSFQELDRVFVRDGEDSKTPWSRAETSECKQFMYSAVIPFGMKAAMAAAWEFLSRDQQGVAGGEYRVIKRTPSTIACKSITTVGASNDANFSGEAQIQMRCAMKKAEERGRIVLVWQSSTVRELLTPASGVSEPTLEQSGWLVLSDAPVSSSGAVATRIQMCVRHPAKMTPLLATYRSSSGWVSHPQTASLRGDGCALDPLTELIFWDAQQNVGAWYQYVENILMEQQRVGRANRAAG